MTCDSYTPYTHVMASHMSNSSNETRSRAFQLLLVLLYHIPIPMATIHTFIFISDFKITALNLSP